VQPCRLRSHDGIEAANRCRPPNLASRGSDAPTVQIGRNGAVGLKPLRSRLLHVRQHFGCTRLAAAVRRIALLVAPSPHVRDGWKADLYRRCLDLDLRQAGFLCYVRGAMKITYIAAIIAPSTANRIHHVFRGVCISGVSSRVWKRIRAAALGWPIHGNVKVTRNLYVTQWK
jgi:hypothetical protein